MKVVHTYSFTYFLFNLTRTLMGCVVAFCRSCLCYGNLSTPCIIFLVWFYFYLLSVSEWYMLLKVIIYNAVYKLLNRKLYCIEYDGTYDRNHQLRNACFYSAA